MKKVLFFPLQIGFCTFGCFYSHSIQAQVNPDPTVNTIVNQNGNVAEITGGQTRGGNLFHSFQEFSVSTGNEAFFNNADSISHIFSRVTGGNISNIDGAIRANGSASLFLINPAGIIFGENARLDIGGSFYGSTASSILFEDREFSAADLENPPLLTVNAPIGLGFRDNPGDIATRSNPNNQSFANLTVNSGQNINLVGGNINLDRSLLNAPGGKIELGGLKVRGEVGINNDGSLSFPEELTRGNISLDNGTLVNVIGDNGGSININANNLDILAGSDILAGIASGSQVADAQSGNITIDVTEKINLASNNPNDSSRLGNLVGDFGDLLTIGSSGDVIINTKILEGNGNVQIGSSTNGEGNAGNVNIAATERVSLLGLEEVATSGILSAVAPSAIGNGADITITTPSLVLSNSALVATSTLGQGNAGNIFINAVDSISLSNTSQIQAASFGIGDAGDVVINAETADISLDGENVLLGTSVIGTGLGGDIIIDGQNLSVTRGASLLTTTAGQATTERLANAGNIQINVSESLIFSGGSLLRSETFGQGNAGDVNITAGNTVSFEGENNQRVSGIINTVEQLPEFLAANFDQQRQGGNINITARDFSLTNGAGINASTNGTGDGGRIFVNVSESLTLDGTTASGQFVSSISNTVGQGAVGNGGSIDISTTNLSITNGAGINASTNGTGDGGRILLDVSESLTLDGTTASGQFVSGISNIVGQGAVGNGGSIDISTTNLSITNGANINASTNGTGDGGRILLDVSESLTLDGTTASDQFASGIFNTVGQGAVGNGGSIDLTTTNLSIANGAVINVSNLGEGDGGDLLVRANAVTLNSGGIFAVNIPSESTAITETPATGGNINLEIADDLILRNNSTLSTQAGSRANGGNIDINTRFIVAFPDGNNDILASSQQGRGGNISIDAESLFGIQERIPNDTTNDINASSQVSGLDGTIDIANPDINPVQSATELPTNVVEPEETAQQACEANRESKAKNELVIEGKGGIRPEPGLPLNSLNTYVNGESNSATVIPAPIETSRGKIQPARGVEITASGEVILTAYQTNNSGYRAPEIKRNCI